MKFELSENVTLVETMSQAKERKVFTPESNVIEVDDNLVSIKFKDDYGLAGPVTLVVGDRRLKIN